jgi:3(or 17)beta-hydroxysteroid dehydrogenase
MVIKQWSESMDQQMGGKIALVTGGAKGLGEAVVRLFVAEGATVVISDVDAENGSRVAASLGGHARFERHDVSVEGQWETIIADTVRRFGRLDVLINNAGVVEVGNIETQTAEQWRFVNSVVSDGTFFGCKHAVRAMKSAGGSIVNVSSVASLQGEPYCAAYVAAKGAVEALTRAVAVHCAQMRYPVRCNSLHPGSISTPMVESFGPKFAAARQSGFELAPAFANMISYSAAPEDIAPAVLYLASPISKWVNGTRLVIDNTQSITRGNVPV